MDEIEELRAEIEACHNELAERRAVRRLDGFARLYAAILAAVMVVLPWFPLYRPYTHGGFTVAVTPVVDTRGGGQGLAWLVLAALAALLMTAVGKERLATVVLPVVLAAVAAAIVALIVVRVDLPRDIELSDTGVASIVCLVLLFVVGILHAFAIKSANDSEVDRINRKRMRNTNG
ncbi:MAG TPA: hypothetical protein VE172_09485 [Stackebrandtia sp.]|jgi:hypothetical protein|uniref:hypothetical protein n=1 Tax=Stackebrandtia sp. TaxID=2023065 RepID=UPI002D3A6D2E|nr:hypothetical protein [Stackebrandtia sp.]HZE39027.1 hypothetical protein [Stackebrandtia sp.]